MNHECVWPFCGSDPDDCKCVFTPIEPDEAFGKKEVMRNDPGHIPEPRPVAPPPVEMAGGDHANSEEANMREKESVPLPEPDLGSIRVGREDICLGHSDEAMRAYGDERERAALHPILQQIGHEQYARAVEKFGAVGDPYSEALARVAELERELAEMTRRRDAWKARAPDIQEFNALREAVRKGINDAGDRDLSRVFLRGALVERNKTIAELEAERDEFSTIAKAAEDKLADAQEMQFAMLSLLADIRKAAGDPEGKLMQPELVELIGRQREECDKAREAEDCSRESMAMYSRARERADRLAEAIKTHNDGLAASCDALAAARQRMCAHYKSTGRRCHDCPRDHEIDAAIAAGGGDVP